MHRLVHFELFADMASAIERDKVIKKWRRAATAAEVLPQPCKHSWQDALSHPSLKPTMAGLVGGAAFRKILPWCARPQNPEHAIEHATRWNPGASAASSRGFALFDRKV